VSGEGNGEQAEGSRSGGRGKAVGLKDPLPLMVRLPAPLQGSLSLKADNVTRLLQAKVQHLENKLRKELDEKEDMRQVSASGADFGGCSEDGAFGGVEGGV